MVQLCRRAPDEALRALDRLPDDFIHDSWLFIGPKASLADRAQALAGRDPAAGIAWQSGLAVIAAPLMNAPGDASFHCSRGQLLAWPGRTEEALQAARTVAGIHRGAGPVWREPAATIYAVPTLLRLDPRRDKIRGDPRFQKPATTDQPTTGMEPDEKPAAADQ